MGYKEVLQQRKPADENNTGEGDILAENNITEIAADLKFFGVDNIRNYPTCIDLRLRDGSSRALPYSYIVEINFTPADGIEVVTTTKKVVIEGRNLQLLYNYLIAYRIKYIQSNTGHDLTDEKELFVKDIKIDDV
jgi:hypothetical protein